MINIGYDENIVATNYRGLAELHEFSSPEEARARALFVQESLTWIGTPFVDCGDIKGPKGCVDCAMLLVRSSVDSGLLPPFDPRPYPPSWLLHRNEERFIEWVVDKLGGVEVEKPRFGDLSVYLFGRTFAHGTINVGFDMVVHAYKVAGITKLSKKTEDTLMYMPIGVKLKRPVKHFDVWSGRWPRT